MEFVLKFVNTTKNICFYFPCAPQNLQNTLILFKIVIMYKEQIVMI